MEEILGGLFGCLLEVLIWPLEFLWEALGWVFEFLVDSSPDFLAGVFDGGSGRRAKRKDERDHPSPFEG
jgi:hypothetical protein